jgi:hypothetical protein
VLFVVIGLTLTACNKQSAPPQTSQQSSQAAAPSPAPAIPAGWTSLSSSRGGFTISWPQNLHGRETDSTVGAWRSNQTSPGMQFFSLDVAHVSDPSFADATLSIGASSDKAALDQCMKPDDTDGNPPPPRTVTLNGAPFTVFSAISKGNSNEDDTTSYRILHAGQCYAIEYDIAYVTIGKKVDPAAYDKLTALLQSIVATFRFQ